MGLITAIDCECSGALRNKANPYDPRNKLLLAGVQRFSTVATVIQQPEILDIEYTNAPYGSRIALLNSLTEQTFVGFNLKFDLAWLRRYGVNLHDPAKNNTFFDCQLAQFLLSKQTQAYPSLETTAQLYGIQGKQDTLQEYLDAGKDVDAIPLDELVSYLKQDLKITLELYQVLSNRLRDEGLTKLFNLQMKDLLVLHDMEYNGMKYDVLSSIKEAGTAQTREDAIKTMLAMITDITLPINWNSNQQLGTVLFGGEFEIEETEEIGVFKTGPKAGLPKYRKVIKKVPYPGMIRNFRPQMSLTASGQPATDSDTLRTLRTLRSVPKAVKEAIDLILEMREFSKAKSTYLEGIPAKISENGWEDDIIHGNINQCVARTGRTSSTGPNLQNIPEVAKPYFVSRYV